LEDQVIRPTVSVMMPLYTGGLTRSAKEIANIQSGRSKLSNQQQQDTQRFELIQSYFNMQLQKQLLDAALFNSNAMQQHYRNALKLEQQGFISKGQRMQFEVARNNAERAQQNAQANLNAALFQLNNLLLDSNITELSTPLFVNRAEPQNVNILLSSFSQNSPLIKKMQMDTELAKANVKAQQAAKRPNVFAFGEYSLDQHQNWIVGVAARYNLFSGIDKNKNIQAAELKRYAAELMTARTQQEIENLIYKSFSEAVSAQQSDALLQQNLKAAQENLRIQELSFKEDVGTATQVIDAQNMLSSLKAEMALNAYKYVISLATLLQSHGSIVEFPNYMQHANTHYIR
ncbi:TolC family protein, partial [Acinetobacter variabilis]|uniref:TolC family protein n=1 Tax=Acinetobacter variabilis TaxID=70346 RepID=UPI003D76797A